MRNRGFTLAELLVAMAISAMLLTLAAPGFTRQRGAAAVRAASNEILAALQLARRIALARGQSVTVCPSADGIACSLVISQSRCSMACRTVRYGLRVQPYPL